MQIETRELAPGMWAEVEELFGKNGACAGCWCMFWRLGEGEKFDDVKGAKAKERFRALVEEGRAHGVLAFVEGKPVGWCSFERRVDLPKLHRAPSLQVEGAERAWSLPCFFVKSGFRGKGVARAMLAAALRALGSRKAEIAEAYPVLPSGEGKVPAAFAYTGVPALFEAAGFSLVQARPKGKQVYRRAMGQARITKRIQKTRKNPA